MNEIESLRQEIYRMQADMRRLKQTLDTHRLLNAKELAAALHRGRNYPAAMKRAGFPMPNGRASLYDAQRWLSEHPEFRVQKSAPDRSRK